jgi:phosphate transport system substrate-binding protein
MSKKHIKAIITLSLVTIISLGLIVGLNNRTKEVFNKTDSKVSGNILIGGSSTVFPLSEVLGEEFNKVNPGVRITIEVSGTSKGIERLIKGEIDIAEASRRINDKEDAIARDNKVEFKELPIAYDGITITVNSQNDWAKDITTEELKMIWEPNSNVKMWSDVRPEWPKEEIKLYGPDKESGTFDYFTEAIIGETGAIRTDYISSEDDNILVQGVAEDKNAMGFFGYSYFFKNQDKLKALSLNGVVPTQETIRDGSYKPLSRPLYLYINEKSINEKPEVKAFVEFYLNKGRSIIPQIGYGALPDEDYEKELNELKSN